MKIVKRKEFLALPEGVVYSKYQPCIIDGVYMKGETRGNNWIYQDLIDSVDIGKGEERYYVVENSREGKPFKMDYYCMDGDGMYEEDQEFMIYDHMDVKRFAMQLVKIADEYPIR
jgi:hypothetical protein